MFELAPRRRRRSGSGTSVTVLSRNDSPRLYQEFSMVDAVSNGRAQLLLGRPSAVESFPLFGYDLGTVRASRVKIAGERGFYAPSRERYAAEGGALFVGSPETVARKIATVARDLRLSRFDLEYDIMRLPREARARTIELFGREVAPRVQRLLAEEVSHV